VTVSGERQRVDSDGEWRGERERVAKGKMIDSEIEIRKEGASRPSNDKEFY
jgi:hypothetical protein